MQRSQRSFYKERKRTRECCILLKRTQERCILLKRVHAQPWVAAIKLCFIIWHRTVLIWNKKLLFTRKFVNKTEIATKLQICLRTCNFLNIWHRFLLQTLLTIFKQLVQFNKLLANFSNIAEFELYNIFAIIWSWT